VASREDAIAGENNKYTLKQLQQNNWHYYLITKWKLFEFEGKNYFEAVKRIKLRGQKVKENVNMDKSIDKLSIIYVTK